MDSKIAAITNSSQPVHSVPGALPPGRSAVPQQPARADMLDGDRAYLRAAERHLIDPAPGTEDIPQPEAPRDRALLPTEDTLPGAVRLHDALHALGYDVGEDEPFLVRLARLSRERRTYLIVPHLDDVEPFWRDDTKDTDVEPTKRIAAMRPMGRRKQ
jgi:hypothetical protein